MRDPQGPTATSGEITTSPTLTYVEQRPEDLTYYLFEAPAPRDVVRVLREQSLALPWGSIALAIIGSSHYLEIRSTGATLCEMLACPHPGLEAVARRAEWNGEGLYDYQTSVNRLSYRFRLSRQSLAARQFEAEGLRLSIDHPHRLSYCFPGGRSGGNALTCVDWEMERSRVVISTHHTFPDELVIVHTRTMIDLAEAGASS